MSTRYNFAAHENGTTFLGKTFEIAYDGQATIVGQTIVMYLRKTKGGAIVNTYGVGTGLTILNATEFQLDEQVISVPEHKTYHYDIWITYDDGQIENPWIGRWRIDEATIGDTTPTATSITEGDSAGTAAAAVLAHETTYAHANLPTEDEKASFPSGAAAATPLALASDVTTAISTHLSDTTHSHISADQLAALPTGISATNQLIAEDSNRISTDSAEADDYAIMMNYPGWGWAQAPFGQHMVYYSQHLTALGSPNQAPLAGAQMFFMQNAGSTEFCIYDYFSLPATTAQAALNANIPSTEEKAAIASLAPLASYDIYPTGTAQVDGLPLIWTAQGGRFYCDIVHGRSPYVIAGDVTSGKRNQPFDIQAWEVTDNDNPALVAFAPVNLSPAEFTVADTVRVWADNDVKTHIRTGF